MDVSYQLLDTIDVVENGTSLNVILAVVGYSPLVCLTAVLPMVMELN
jgi:hypothetical protein